MLFFQITVTDIPRAVKSRLPGKCKVNYYVNVYVASRNLRVTLSDTI